MFKLTEDQIGIMTALCADKRELFDALQLWLAPLTPEECYNMAPDTASILQENLLRLAQSPDLFKPASMVLSKIYDDTLDCGENSAEAQFKQSFSAENTRISLKVKQEVLMELLNSSDGNKNRWSMAFYILEVIFPCENVSYMEFVLRAIDSTIKTQSAEFKLRVKDFVIAILDELAMQNDFSGTLVSIIKHLKFSNELFFEVSELPFSELSQDGKKRYFSVLDEVSPTRLKDKISSFIFANTIRFPPKSIVRDNYAQDLMSGKIRVSEFFQVCIIPANSHDETFAQECALVLAREVAALPNDQAGAQEFTDIFAMILFYSDVLITEEEVQDEQMTLFAEMLAKVIPEFRVGEAVSRCKTILKSSIGMRTDFAISFINHIYQKFPKAVQEGFKGKPELLATHKILFHYDFEEDSGVTWAPIAHFLFNNHFNEKVKKRINTEIQVFDSADKESLFVSLLGGAGFSSEVELWAGNGMESAADRSGEPEPRRKRLNFGQGAAKKRLCTNTGMIVNA